MRQINAGAPTTGRAPRSTGIAGPAPKLSRGFHELVEQLQPEQASLIAPVETSFEIRPGIWVQPPLEVGQQPA